MLMVFLLFFPGTGMGGGGTIQMRAASYQYEIHDCPSPRVNRDLNWALVTDKMMAAIIGVVVVLSNSLAAQERRAAPRVPADMLQGQRLVDKGSGLSVLAPDKWVWVWFRQDEAGARDFAATNPAGGLGFAVSVVRADFAWTRGNAEDVQVGMAKKLTATGFKVDRRVFESSAVPVPNSYRFFWAIVTPNGDRRFRFGYIAHSEKRIVSFTCIGMDEREPEEFTRFVRSARLL
jgi:hypothetical protein